MKKKFELWLDESGTFANDNLIIESKMPSHVGGILYDCDDDLKPILSIAPKDGFHAMESTDANYVYEQFQRIAKEQLKFVLFQNKERLVIVDDKLTYLEIISEGILEVIKRLKTIYGDIYLTVFVAVRKDNPKAEMIAREKGGTPSDYFIEIKRSEYIKQLRSKILLNGLNKGIKEEDWRIEFGSARHDKKLLLCDVVCNVFFTKDTKIRTITVFKTQGRYGFIDNKTYFYILQVQDKDLRMILLNGGGVNTKVQYSFGSSINGKSANRIRAKGTIVNQNAAALVHKARYIELCNGAPLVFSEH